MQAWLNFLNWCAGEGFIDSNPAMLTNKNPEQTRDRVLSDDELRQIWLALPDGDFGDILKLLLLTGQRQREIADLEWDELDLDRAIITLPKERTKNKRLHTIPLSAPALDILKARTPYADRALVFGRSGSRGYWNWNNAKRKLDAQLKIAEPWVIHDLRRTAATRMNEIGIQPHIVEAMLNHRSGFQGGRERRLQQGALSKRNDRSPGALGRACHGRRRKRQSKVTPLARQA